MKASPLATAQPEHSETEAIVLALETDIIFGRLHPRERLVEDELIARFGVTRHKVRRAITELVMRGLVVQERNKGAQVRDYPRSEVEELYEIRNVLQAHAIARMPMPMEESVITRLRDLQSAHADASRQNAFEDMFHLNNQFHDLFFSACGNSLLTEAVRDYAWRTHPIRSRGFFDATYRAAAVQDHYEMVEAAANADLHALLQINLRHTNRPRMLYLNSLP